MRKIFALATLAIALLAGSAPFTSAASAEGIEVTDICPELTDSVDRLYSAYFLRPPDNAGIDFWLTEYSEGRWSLAGMSQFFSGSDEFVGLYGSLSNQQFVNLIYQNILGRTGEASGVQFWTDQLNTGARTRGQVMLAFSEGPEYVAITGTAQPMAGYYQSYPEGTMWYCGTENRDIPFSPGTVFYADGFAELSETSVDVTENFIIRTEGPRRELNSILVNSILERGTYGYFWNGRYDIIAPWQDTQVLEISGIDTDETGFRWAVAVYDTSIGSARGGLGDFPVEDSFGGSLAGCNGC